MVSGRPDPSSNSTFHWLMGVECVHFGDHLGHLGRVLTLAIRIQASNSAGDNGVYDTCHVENKGITVILSSTISTFIISSNSENPWASYGYTIFSGNINPTIGMLPLYSYALRDNPIFGNKLCINTKEYSIGKYIQC
ncbi:hypothetical protein Patl1_30195 [Pistacia atlantica]|uniref:Uncharacterized protein n=1 Tax=Pistacia atlantica TaxID=434234 RepID=A0ACC1ABY9_9ROSI|nr:hypothetical protein Patl1_30195 [Pistacia atlantica]